MHRSNIKGRVAAAGGGAALVALTALIGGCGDNGSPAPSSTTVAPSTTTPTPSSQVPVSPTEKSIIPTGGNLFAPSVHATPAPNIPGGQHHGINGIP
jgi:hypothetical protein